jgi:hypothetical protein
VLNKIIYIAGLFDGEGSFSIHTNITKSKGKCYVNFVPIMSISLKYGSEVFQEVIDALGGKVYSYKTGEYRWYLGHRDKVKIAAEILLPYLRIKKDIAKKFLEALSYFPPIHTGAIKSWTPELIDKIGTIALTLNPPTARKSIKGLEYLEEMKKTCVLADMVSSKLEEYSYK